MLFDPTDLKSDPGLERAHRAGWRRVAPGGDATAAGRCLGRVSDGEPPVRGDGGAAPRPGGLDGAEGGPVPGGPARAAGPETGQEPGG